MAKAKTKPAPFVIPTTQTDEQIEARKLAAEKGITVAAAAEEIRAANQPAADDNEPPAEDEDETPVDEPEEETPGESDAMDTDEPSPTESSLIDNLLT